MFKSIDIIQQLQPIPYVEVFKNPENDFTLEAMMIEFINRSGGKNSSTFICPPELILQKMDGAEIEGCKIKVEHDPKNEKMRAWILEHYPDWCLKFSPSPRGHPIIGQDEEDCDRKMELYLNREKKSNNGGFKSTLEHNKREQVKNSKHKIACQPFSHQTGYFPKAHNLSGNSGNSGSGFCADFSSNLSTDTVPSSASNIAVSQQNLELTQILQNEVKTAQDLQKTCMEMMFQMQNLIDTMTFKFNNFDLDDSCFYDETYLDNSYLGCSYY